MNAADGVFVVAVAIAGVIGWRTGAGRCTAAVLGFAVGTVLGGVPAAAFAHWVLHVMEKTHNASSAIANVALVGHFCARVMIALAAALLFHRVAEKNRAHWPEAFSDAPWSTASRFVGAADGTLLGILLACEVALLLAATISGGFGHTIQSSTWLAPASRFFALGLQ
ncbi:MAG: hypothetical protein M0Z88_09620 [Actinomycetota bacterium]|nr:hypothetical protein [Actinomycetota bacterium]